MSLPADLPTDVASLQALLRAAEERASERDARLAERDAVIERKEERIVRLEKLVADFKRAMFGAKSEKTDPDQYQLALEDIETAIATVHAEDEAIDPPKAQPRKRNANRGALPKHLPRVEEIITPESTTCDCGCDRHVIGEDTSERLDIIPAQFRVIVTRRPKYACRSCESGVVQAPAVSRLIESGLPTEATVASVIVAKFADHLPLYRQAQIYARQGVDLDRSTLAAWVGKAAWELAPVYDALIADLKRSTKLFMDETTAPVLDPKRQANIRLAYCWAHARRKLFELTKNSAAPIAEEELRQITALYRVETQIRSLPASQRLAVRQDKSVQMLADFKTWLEQARAQVSVKSPTGEALKYIAKYSDGLILFLSDGRIEMDNNTVERTNRPIAIGRKNSLFAGHEAGAQNWAVLASLIETCKLNGIEPHSYLTRTLTAIVNGHRQSQVGDLLPWHYAQTV